MVRSAAAMETAGQQVVPANEARVAALLQFVVASMAVGRRTREPKGLPCPRYESVNTKFCYYNNYNLAQPRHFCRACQRYWMRGGVLRNVRVGSGTRKATPTGRRKRSSASAPVPSSSIMSPNSALVVPPLPLHGGSSLLHPYSVGVGVGL